MIFGVNISVILIMLKILLLMDACDTILQIMDDISRLYKNF